MEISVTDSVLIMIIHKGRLIGTARTWSMRSSRLLTYLPRLVIQWEEHAPHMMP
eukprot:SAG25_NODE_395_length_8553_cov_4.407263_12_plen_54_part_00